MSAIGWFILFDIVVVAVVAAVACWFGYGPHNDYYPDYTY